MRRGGNNQGGNIYLNTGSFSEPATYKHAAVGPLESGGVLSDGGGAGLRKQLLFLTLTRFVSA